jgi:hypothetical protein
MLRFYKLVKMHQVLMVDSEKGVKLTKENFKGSLQHGREDWYTAKGVDMAQKYNVQYLDTKYVFDKNGVIKWTDVKPLEYSSIKPLLWSLL